MDGHQQHLLGLEEERRMLTKPRRQQGFTLIEAVVTITVMGILMAVAAPSLSTYSENAKVRAITESFLASAQNARAEAIRSNRAVQIILTSDTPTAANVASATQSNTASNWIVRRDDSVTATPAYIFIEGKNARESSGRSDGTSSVNVSALYSDASVAKGIAFTGSSQTTDLDGTASKRWDVNFSSATAACAPAGPVCCLRVTVSVSGQIKACDPQATAANDSRAC